MACNEVEEFVALLIERLYEHQTCRRGRQFGSLLRSSTGDGLVQSRVEFVCHRRGDRSWRLTWHGRLIAVRFRWTIRRSIGGVWQAAATSAGLLKRAAN